MRAHPLATCMLLGAVAVGCTDQTPTDVADGPGLHLGLGNVGKTVPLRGAGTITVAPSPPTVDCEAPDGSVVALFPAQWDALAQYTILGRTVGVITVDACRFAPTDGTLLVEGGVVQTAANGGQLNAAYVITIFPDFSLDGEVEISGGTGRFEGASGHGHLTGAVDLITGSGRTWLHGRLSIPGSS